MDDTREDQGPSAPFYNSLSYLGKLRLFTECLKDDRCVHLGMFREVLFSGDAFFSLSYLGKLGLFTECLKDDDNELMDI